jgi:hypothetical protein
MEMYPLFLLMPPLPRPRPIKKSTYKKRKGKNKGPLNIRGGALEKMHSL